MLLQKGDVLLVRQGAASVGAKSVPWKSVGSKRQQLSTSALVPLQQHQHLAQSQQQPSSRARVVTGVARTSYPPATYEVCTEAPTDVLYDAVIIGSGMGGLAAAAKLVERGASVLVLEKYLVPGGSSAAYKRDGYTFDVGSSMMFGMGHQGTTNLITRALTSVGRQVETIPDPTQIHYHLPASAAHPNGLNVRVWRDYDDFVEELSRAFPHQREGIRRFYGECWNVFNALNSLELKSLEEPRYLLEEFSKKPLECLRLASYLTTNTGEVARRYITDPELLRFIDVECYIWSTVVSELTPVINAGMVFCDRHYGGINYPVGGVGRLSEELVSGIRELGGQVVFKANVKEIIMEGSGTAAKAVGVRLADGREFRGKTVISNATRWDTFGHLVPEQAMPKSEHLFRSRYRKAPSFFTMHLGVREDVLPHDTDVHHVLLDKWSAMEDARGTVFVSLPSILDRSLCPPGTHIIHAFTPDWIGAWQGLDVADYEAAKQAVADKMVERMEVLFPGLKNGIVFQEVATPRTHRRFLSRVDGTYGPIPSRPPLGMLSMPMNTTSIDGLYCTGDSTFPGQGVNAAVFSGFGAAHRVAVDLGFERGLPMMDKTYKSLLNYVRDSS